MSLLLLKNIWRVFAFFTFVLLYYSICDIPRFDRMSVESDPMFGCLINWYRLYEINSFFLAALFALLVFGLIKLNKTKDGWKHMQMEIYTCIVFLMTHFTILYTQYILV